MYASGRNPGYFYYVEKTEIDVEALGHGSGNPESATEDRGGVA